MNKSRFDNMSSSQVKREIAEAVSSHCDGVNEEGWMIRGHVGKSFPCQTCGLQRFDDGTQCKGCGSWVRRKVN